jgi:uncharacterized oxidoreductase
MGIDSHGLMRIPQYVKGIKDGEIRLGAPTSVVAEAGATAVVDCGWNFGQVGALRAMEIGIERTRQYHSVYILTRRCGHAGRLGAFTQFAAERGFLAIAVGRASCLGHYVLPWGGCEPRLGTNPISFAIPTDFGFPILSDFSTCTAPEGKIRVYRDEGKLLPPDWITDAEGQPTSDPSDFYGPPRGAILPFGGELGYRGYALSILVECLGGTLAGEDITVGVPGTGVSFIVIDVEALLPRSRFNQLVGQIRRYLKSTPPAKGFREVQLPGEPEFCLAQARRRDGIPVDDKVWAQICDAARSVGIEWTNQSWSES